jgi:hypothetical protein
VGRRAGDFAGWLIFGMRPVPLGVLTATLSEGQTEQRLICNLSPATSCIEPTAPASGNTDAPPRHRRERLRTFGRQPQRPPPSGKPARSSVIKLFEPDIQTA